MRALVARAAEGCFLLRALGDHNLGRLAARCDEGTQRILRDALKLRDWVCAANGEAAAAALISVLITEHLSATGGRPCSFRAWPEEAAAGSVFYIICDQSAPQSFGLKDLETHCELVDNRAPGIVFGY